MKNNCWIIRIYLKVWFILTIFLSCKINDIHCASNDMPDRAHRRQLSQFGFNFISKILASGRNNLSDIMPWILFSSVSFLDWREEKNQFALTKETFRLKWYFSKGQLISKGLLASSILPKNERKKIRLYYYDTSGRLVFVRFLGEIEDTKKTFRN